MVRKIQQNEYLKRYDNMPVAERQAYDERVGKWLRSGAKTLDKRAETFEARLQNVVQVSAAWNDAECAAFEEGARLLSAVSHKTDTWLPEMLYTKSAKRAIRKMYEVLSELENGGTEAQQKPKEEPAEGTRKATPAVGENAPTVPQQQTEQGQTAKAPFRTQSVGDNNGKGSDQQAVGEKPLGEPAGVTTMAEGALPVRPKHIDQYVHLLPQKTQERAAQVKGLLQELDEAREKMCLLMDDPTAKSDDREAWAKKTTSIDNKLRSIYDELDREWDKLAKSGRVVVDDLSNARVVPAADATDTTDEGPAELTSEQKARRRELRKWLVDTRRGNGDTRDDHVAKWRENFREYLTLEGDAAFEDEKIIEAAKHYGINIEELKN